MLFVLKRKLFSFISFALVFSLIVPLIAPFLPVVEVSAAGGSAGLRATGSTASGNDYTNYSDGALGVFLTSDPDWVVNSSKTTVLPTKDDANKNTSSSVYNLNTIAWAYGNAFRRTNVDISMSLPSESLLVFQGDYWQAHPDSSLGAKFLMSSYSSGQVGDMPLDGHYVPLPFTKEYFPWLPGSINGDLSLLGHRDTEATIDSKVNTAVKDAGGIKAESIIDVIKNGESAKMFENLFSTAQGGGVLKASFLEALVGKPYLVYNSGIVEDEAMFGKNGNFADYKKIEGILNNAAANADLVKMSKRVWGYISSGCFVTRATGSAQYGELLGNVFGTGFLYDGKGIEDPVLHVAVELGLHQVVVTDEGLIASKTDDGKGVLISKSLFAQALNLSSYLDTLATLYLASFQDCPEAAALYKTAIVDLFKSASSLSDIQPKTILILENFYRTNYPIGDKNDTGYGIMFSDATAGRAVPKWGYYYVSAALMWQTVMASPDWRLKAQASGYVDDKTYTFPQKLNFDLHADAESFPDISQSPHYAKWTLGKGVENESYDRIRYRQFSSIRDTD